MAPLSFDLMQTYKGSWQHFACRYLQLEPSGRRNQEKLSTVRLAGSGRLECPVLPFSDFSRLARNRQKLPNCLETGHLRHCLKSWRAACVTNRRELLRGAHFGRPAARRQSHDAALLVVHPIQFHPEVT